MNTIRHSAALLAAALIAPVAANADDGPAPAPQGKSAVLPLGTDLEHFAYPWPVRFLPVVVGDEDARMAYMDVRPERPNGKTAVLLHGKNFCGATWEASARALLDAGYRVVIPDQLGFCKSSKPRDAQYSFAMMAEATHRLIASLGIGKPVIIAHSTGGMLALRFALMYPQVPARLVLINPLGLVDRMEQGVPYRPLAVLLEREKAKDRAAIKAYQLNTYYHGQWRPAYDRWVDMLAGQYATDDGDAVELAQAKTAEMILTQPVSHEFGRLAVPVTLMIGMKDTTTFGKGQAPDAVKARLRPIPEVAAAAAAAMPASRIVRFAGYGHSPQVEAPAAFNRALLAELARSAP
ncbi:alpha/beta fold hydrolase [Novosphingobium beihaiensis]|uniref:Alpha/beta hydrolase n=1 Tax=Novosphingobium beihaiensis TaxID=2930389 RepID=A0ABT0BJM7_9SPHN|nr:alpha/beta hydrolase [Novosphingobium beihaiensis]MCJ2185256.1 alpha/beta hydrolase [Novosphingobium beihaiensis]